MLNLDDEESGDAAKAGEAPDMAVIGVTSLDSPDPSQSEVSFAALFGQNRVLPDGRCGGCGARGIGALLKARHLRTGYWSPRDIVTRLWVFLHRQRWSGAGAGTDTSIRDHGSCGPSFGV